MKRALFFMYGVACYLIFFATFLYAVGFLGNVLVPKSVDTGLQGGESNGWLIDIVLLSLFAIQHSVMARQGFKKWWTRLVPKPIERSTYVLFSSLALIALFWYWRPISDITWNVRGSIGGTVLTATYFLGWGIVLFFHIPHQPFQSLRAPPGIHDAEEPRTCAATVCQTVLLQNCEAPAHGRIHYCVLVDAAHDSRTSAVCLRINRVHPCCHPA